MAKIRVDGVEYDVEEGRNLLHACLGLGLDLPYFCWHPTMGSVGACRQCAVKQYKDDADRKGRIVMACLTPAADGSRISIADPEAVAFRAAVIEGLMQSHPHDCPVCDEGGECHLQDMTVMTGHAYRRYAFRKRTFRSQDLGPLLAHEMNRCIQCYRCVRFYREYAGGRDFNAFHLRNTVFFGRAKDGVLENEFSGNLVEVCPTGVFTDATLKRHYTRKWDLRMAPSVCVHCGLGCNVTPGERYGLLRRIVNRYNGEVNGYFLCDRGRYGYEFVNSDRRIRRPRVRRDDEQAPAESDEALERARAAIAGGGAVGIGSPRASLEANFALRSLVGPDRFFAGMSDDELRLVRISLEVLKASPARAAALRGIEASDAVLVLGEDVTQAAPRIALALRQSVLRQPSREAEKLRIPLWLDHAVREVVQDARGPLFIASPRATRLDDVAARAFHAAPDDLARLGFAVSHAIDPASPGVPDPQPGLRELAGEIATALRGAQAPLVISGTGCGSEAVIRAAGNVVLALRRAGRAAGLRLVAPECNSVGLALLDPRPLGEVFDAARKGEASTVIVLENDLYRRASAAEVDALLSAARHTIDLDHLANATSARAEVVLPAGSFAEAEGTLVSCEPRAQRFFRVLPPEGDVRESWRWLRDIAIAAGRLRAGSWPALDDLIASLCEAFPALEAVRAAAPSAAFRMADQRVPRAPHRLSGRTAMLANVTIHEPKPPADPDSPLSFTMEGTPVQPPAALQPFFWSGGWNSIQAVNKFQSEIGGPLRGGDAGIPLIEPGKDGRGEYSGQVPAGFAPRKDEWLVVSLHHLFGSEELSSAAPAIASLAPEPYVALGPEDAGRLRAAAGARIRVAFAGSELLLPLLLEPSLPKGVAGVPAGFPALRGVALPGWARMRVES